MGLGRAMGVGAVESEGVDFQGGLQRELRREDVRTAAPLSPQFGAPGAPGKGEASGERR